MEMKSGLRITGLVFFMVGITFMPIPVTSPKAVTSIFPWLAMNGLLVRYGLWAMAVGAVLFALSFGLRGRD